MSPSVCQRLPVSAVVGVNRWCQTPFCWCPSSARSVGVCFRSPVCRRLSPSAADALWACGSRPASRSIRTSQCATGAANSPDPGWSSCRPVGRLRWSGSGGLLRRSPVGDRLSVLLAEVAEQGWGSIGRSAGDRDPAGGVPAGGGAMDPHGGLVDRRRTRGGVGADGPPGAGGPVRRRPRVAAAGGRAAPMPRRRRPRRPAWAPPRPAG